VGHDVVRAEGYDIARPERPVGSLGEVCLRDLLDDRLTH
jgi:hypothetical protein